MSKTDNNALEGLFLPVHTAIILDGNGTWAKLRGEKRTYGHKQGAKTLANICKYASDIKLQYLTVFAFSTENWKRNKEEVVAQARVLLEEMGLSDKEDYYPYQKQGIRASFRKYRLRRWYRALFRICFQNSLSF